MEDIDDELSSVAMHVILNAGDARALMDEALEQLAEFDFDGAAEKMTQARDKILAAHASQTDIIQRQAAGEKFEYSILFVHAQDTLMTIDAELHMVDKMTPLVRALFERVQR